jgi:archaemetzincin
MKKKIGLIKIGVVDQSILDKLKSNLEIVFKDFRISVGFFKDIIPTENSDYNVNRSQYNALRLLKKINLIIQNKPYFRLLGIIDQDIYSNSYKFLLGRASKPKEDNPMYPVGALISLTRLREKFYGRTNNQMLFEQRILKEAIHELGHTFGLPHCHKYCIMRFSNSITDTDNKPSAYCKSCLITLRKFFKSLNTTF